MKIAQYTIINTNGNKRNPHNRVAVRNTETGELLAEVCLTRRNPLAYVRQYKTGKYARDLLTQLIRNGVEWRVISAILDI